MKHIAFAIIATIIVATTATETELEAQESMMHPSQAMAASQGLLQKLKPPSPSQQPQQQQQQSMYKPQQQQNQEQQQQPPSSYKPQQQQYQEPNDQPSKTYKPQSQQGYQKMQPRQQEEQTQSYKQQPAQGYQKMQPKQQVEQVQGYQKLYPKQQVEQKQNYQMQQESEQPQKQQQDKSSYRAQKEESVKEAFLRLLRKIEDMSETEQDEKVRMKKWILNEMEDMSENNEQQENVREKKSYGSSAKCGKVVVTGCGPIVQKAKCNSGPYKRSTPQYEYVQHMPVGWDEFEQGQFEEYY
ncbi:putative uncharacterized protein DDB_G0294196 [Condylostylus longicornis]|uniref:putative uncharacterized protein DDB_G0294196 n=1 Tax=Condylostylus longicornis TaxID=2530218 RepID=UPI00244DED42|nr:putative uncharacterized protein DDB_G0294196 [Condylostylus longicornis]